jgi:hypothetical protein
MGAPNNKGCDEARLQITRLHSLKHSWNEIGDEDNVKAKFLLRCKDDGKNSENARNKSEMMGGLD